MTKNSSWILKIDGKTDRIGTFNTYEECVDTALALISRQFTNIGGIIDAALKQRHTKICREFIRNFKNFSGLRTANLLEPFYDYSEKYGVNEHRINENSFCAEWSTTDTTIFSIDFGKDLFIETNIWDEDAESYFLFVRSKTDCIKYSLYEKKTLSTVANSFLVYQALMSTPTPQLRKEIRENIIRNYGGQDCSGYEGSGYEINISDDTISNQIHALQKLGIPIYERSVSVEDKKNQATLISIYGDKYKDGYYIDNDRPLTPDYSKLTPGSYIMLVYLTLKEIDRAHALPTQQAIVDAVYNKFEIRIKRESVGGYIDLLNDLGAGIRHNKSGYWMK